MTISQTAPSSKPPFLDAAVYPAIKYAFLPLQFGFAAGAVYARSGAATHFHEKVGHAFFGYMPFVKNLEYIIINNCATTFRNNLEQIFDTHSTFHKRITHFQNLLGGNGGRIRPIGGYLNLLGRIVGLRPVLAWSVLSAPLLDSIKYNSILACGVFLTIKGLQNEDQRIPFGLALTGFSIIPLLDHLAYVALPYSNKKGMLMRYKEGSDVETCAVQLYKATKISPFAMALALRIGFFSVPFFAIRYAYRATQ